jgi:hypothetical protein
MEWAKGIIASLVAILIIVILLDIGISQGGFPAFISAVCTILSTISVLVLIYAIEEDAFEKGFTVPILLAIAMIIRYYGAPPVAGTIFLCILGSILAVIIASIEGC